MTMLPTVFCADCGCKQHYRVTSSRTSISVRGIDFSYVEQTAYCAECGTEVYVPEINDANAQAREDAYRVAADLITMSEINQILEKYSIGARPLASILGFGEITINRYMNGQLPSKSHSDLMLEVLNSHRKMDELLEQNKDSISDVAYRKCRAAIDRIKELYGRRKIEVIARYFVINLKDITNLSLQKLLYYAQGFYYALFHEALFTDTCQAWTYGPVFPEIYRTYKINGTNPIELPKEEYEKDLSELTTRERDFLDAIISAFGSYSGSVLINITHKEQPWLNARGSLLPSDRCTNIIKLDDIYSYFQTIVSNYSIVNPCDIIKYSSAMFSRHYFQFN